MYRSKTVPSKSLATLLLAFAPLACSDEPAGLGEPEVQMDGRAHLRVLITDAPSDYIDGAMVDIGRVELLPAGGGPPIVLDESGTDGYVNLLDFQDAATTPIAEAEVDPGTFGQLRLVVEAAKAELKAPYEFRDGSTEMELKVPSGAQTGIKLNLHNQDGTGPLEIVPGETVLVLDFDVNRSFVIQGNPDTPAGVKSVIFTPSIRVTGRDVAASISGTVWTDLEDVSVHGLTVVAEPTDGGTVAGYQTMTGTALTGEDGSYTIHFLVPGAYDVTVELPDEGLGTDPAVRPVVVGDSENATGEDFEIIDITGSISGTVTTMLTGVSVEGLTVAATLDGGGTDPLTTMTASDGTYAFDPVLMGTYVVTVTVGDDQLTDPTEEIVEVGPGQDVVDVDFEVIEDLTGSINGTLTTEITGFSLEGLTVTATPIAPGTDPVMGVTLADGTYSIASVPAGSYVVTVAAGMGFTTVPPSTLVVVGEDAVVPNVNFTVVESGS